jgi:hypothetical protein
VLGGLSPRLTFRTSAARRPSRKLAISAAISISTAREISEARILRDAEKARLMTGSARSMRRPDERFVEGFDFITYSENSEKGAAAKKRNS